MHASVLWHVTVDYTKPAGFFRTISFDVILVFNYVYFILEVQMNYTRAYTDKLWLEVFVKMTSMFHAHRNLRFKWNRRRGQQPGARFVIDLQVWSGSLKSKHL